MPELLLELLSEEIPARMQSAAARELLRLMIEAFKTAGLAHGDARAFATPRRLAFTVDGLPLGTPDVREERKGPRVGAPEAAMQGFLRSTRLTLGDLQKRSDGKGEFYVALIEKRGAPTVEVIAGIVPAIVAGFHWPKSMRWGAGHLRWVRPLHSVLCVFDGRPVPLAISTGDGEIIAGDSTLGHRFLSDGAIRVTSFADYREKLAKAHVVLDGEERKSIIERELKRLAATAGLEPIEDGGLLEEVAGLVEDPVVLLGRIDEAFLDVPHEVLSTAMRAHQKYFSLRDAKTGKFAARFGVVANLRAKDGGKAIVAGNERVLRARLSDARFFWDQDHKVTLDSRVEALKAITFHAKLGTQFERVERIERLARVIAPLVGASADEAARAARLAKADLTTGMVGEFPELQGVMGRYYALKDGEPASVADAVRDHYKPQGPNDEVPKAPVSIAVALADKLDMLVAFFGMGEVPTGSKDPFGLRRAALGDIRIILTQGMRLPLSGVMRDVLRILIEVALGAGRSVQFWKANVGRPADEVEPRSLDHEGYDFFTIAPGELQLGGMNASVPFAAIRKLDVTQQLLLDFIGDRLKVYLRDRGARHDLVDAVFSLPGQDDLVLIVKRVEALSKFLATEDGKSLRVAHDRAANILRIEEKKDGKPYTDAPDAKLYAQDEERDLAAAIAKMQKAAGDAVASADFEAAMRALSVLRAPVDRFFDKVTVNAKEPALRANRLKLLALIRRAMTEVADFSKLEGAQ